MVIVLGTKKHENEGHNSTVCTYEFWVRSPTDGMARARRATSHVVDGRAGATSCRARDRRARIHMRRRRGDGRESDDIIVDDVERARRARVLDDFTQLTGTSVDTARRWVTRASHALDVALDAFYAFDAMKSTSATTTTTTSGEVPKMQVSMFATAASTGADDAAVLNAAVNDAKRLLKEYFTPRDDGFVPSIPLSLEAAAYTADALIEWAQRVAARDVDVPWSDEDFAPEPSSIDGRRGARGSDDTVPKCKCGVQAAVKRVHKDGKNNGRLFYGCAKPTLAHRGAGAPSANTERCDFFAWAKEETLKHTDAATRLRWERLAPPRFKFARRVSAADIRQGSVGDCWFLSALAVVAEREDLLQSVIGVSRDLSTIMERVGSYFVRFFLGGRWRAIVVDDHLPIKDVAGKARTPVDERTPAFSRAANNQTWVSITEKAYAKAHGSYGAISGGYIAEGLHDLTGAATEMISFSSREFDSEDLWVRLLSYASCGFRMGAATSFSAEGIVGGHAYSILEVVELHDVKKGVQMKLTDVFAAGGARVASASTDVETLRLVKLRNPWGRREWRGEFSSKSMAWTKRLGDTLSRTRADDGTFWMSYQDVLVHFSSIDVCKTPRGWHAVSVETTLHANDASLPQFLVRTDDGDKSAHCHVLLLQHTTRGRQGQMYVDLSLFAWSRASADGDGAPWTPRGVIFGAREREASQGELMLDSGTDYLFSIVSIAGAPSRDCTAPVTLRICAANAIKAKAARYAVATFAQNLLMTIHIPSAMALAEAQKQFRRRRARIELCGGFIDVFQCGGEAPWSGLVFGVAQADFDRTTPLRVHMSYTFEDDAAVHLCEPLIVIHPGRARLVAMAAAVGSRSTHAFTMSCECVDCACADPECVIIENPVAVFSKAVRRTPPPRRLQVLFDETDAAFWCASSVASSRVRRHTKRVTFASASTTQ